MLNLIFPKSNKFEMFLAAEQAGLNSGIISSLIMAGCMDSLVKTRTKGVFECQLWSRVTERERKLVVPLGKDFDFDLITIIKHLNEQQKIKDSRMNTLRKDTKIYQEIYKLNNENIEFACLFYEMAVLGYYYTTTLKKIFQHSVPELCNIEEIRNCEDDDRSKS